MASLVTISQKCQYALRAMYELALHYPSDRVTVLSEIANAQDIPVRFLELIIAKLRKEGYVRSQRGQSAEINFRKGYEEQYEKTDSFIFKSLYEEARRAISQVFDTKTLQDLMEKRKNNMGAFDYKI